jgi:hypothetical protein
MTPADSSGVVPTHSTLGYREPTVGREEDCQRITAEAWLACLVAYVAAVTGNVPPLVKVSRQASLPGSGRPAPATHWYVAQHLLQFPSTLN